MEQIRDHIKNYYDTSFKRTFSLFPLYLNKQQKKRGGFIGIDEEKKGDQQELSFKDRYYIYNYLKNNSDLNQLLITDAGVPLNQAKLTSSDQFLEIKVETFKQHFNTIRQNLINITSRLLIQEVDTSSYILLLSDLTNPLSGNEIRTKIQDNFNVTITCPVNVQLNRGGQQEGGRGGMIGGAPRFAPGSFHVKRICYNFPPKEEMKDFLPVQINQKYIVTGMSQDVLNSVQVVKSTLDKY